MTLNLVNLDDRTRQYMLQELERDIASGSLYMSTRFNEIGRREYPALMREAISTQDDTWLAHQIRNGLMNLTETKRTPKGNITTANVPVTAPDTFAEGEFNRFYARGLCLRAIEDGIQELTVYRAKEVSHARSASIAMIGTTLNVQTLLNDLRTHQGMDTAFHLPPGPNSGLSVRLP